MIQWHGVAQKEGEEAEKQEQECGHVGPKALRSPWAVTLIDKRTDMSENEKQNQHWRISSAGFT